ncbi:hypothetical protein [Amycolatopsis sp. NPDC051903]|uniref:hypothetical protein n=1 Tax=Amycolatopsis sp. NPDC051903 TaxID=3363936 RepID=UPI0037942175
MTVNQPETHASAQSGVKVRVAVTVFVDAEGVDVRDAHRVAERAVTTAVTAADLTVTIDSGAVHAVEVVDVQTINAALRSGALQLIPAGRAR